MTTASENQEAPDPAVPLTVTHAPATRLESGEILATPEDHELHELAIEEEREKLMVELEEQAHG